MQQVYVNGLIQRTPEICGRKLLPLSLGHSLILDLIASPIPLGQPISDNDVLAFVWVCSQRFESVLSGLADWDKTRLKIASWGGSVSRRAIRRQRVWRFWRRKVWRPIDIGAARRACVDYWDYYSTLPAMWETESEATYDGAGKPKTYRKAKVPWQYMVAFNLLGKFAESDVWNMPLCRAMAWHACYLDRDGESNLMPDEAVNLAESMDAGEGDHAAPRGHADGNAGGGETGDSQ